MKALAETFLRKQKSTRNRQDETLPDQQEESSPGYLAHYMSPGTDNSTTARYRTGVPPGPATRSPPNPVELSNHILAAVRWPDEHPGTVLPTPQSVDRSLPSVSPEWPQFDLLSAESGWFELPKRSLADSLVDAFFDRFHRLWPFMHEGTFRTQYENIWCRSTSSMACDPTFLPWLSLLYMVLAHGCECCYRLSASESAVATLTFVKRSQNIIKSHYFSQPVLETVQALLLLCHFMKSAVELDESWTWLEMLVLAVNRLRLAAKSGGQLDFVEHEVRKRVWWGCFHIDHSLTTKFGRNPILGAWKTQCAELPIEIDDQYINSGSTNPRQPTGLPSTTAFYVSTIKLGQVMIKILNELYLKHQDVNEEAEASSLKPTKQHQTLSDVLRLEGHLQSWWNDTPSHLTRDASGAPVSIYLQRQRCVFKIR